MCVTAWTQLRYAGFFFFEYFIAHICLRCGSLKLTFNIAWCRSCYYPNPPKGRQEVLCLVQFVCLFVNTPATNIRVEVIPDLVPSFPVPQKRCNYILEEVGQSYFFCCFFLLPFTYNGQNVTCLYIKKINLVSIYFKLGTYIDAIGMLTSAYTYSSGKN